jgi:hypothetical protein
VKGVFFGNTERNPLRGVQIEGIFVYIQKSINVIGF